MSSLPCYCWQFVCIAVAALTFVQNRRAKTYFFCQGISVVVGSVAKALRGCNWRIHDFVEWWCWVNAGCGGRVGGVLFIVIVIIHFDFAVAARVCLLRHHFG